MRTVALLGLMAVLVSSTTWIGTWGSHAPRTPVLEQAHSARPASDAAARELTLVNAVGRAEGLDPEVEIHAEDYPGEDASDEPVALPPTPPLEISGLVFIPEEWHLDAYEVHARFVGSARSAWIAGVVGAEAESVEGNRVRSWTALVPEPGRYRVELWEPEFSIELDVQRSMAGVELRVPKPTQLSIRVVDGVTKSPIAGARVSCRGAQRGVQLFRSAVEPLDDAAGLFETRCVAGDIELGCSARALGYDSQRFTTRVPAGEFAIVVALFTATRLKVHLVDAETLAPLHSSDPRTEIGYVLEGPGGLYRTEIMRMGADKSGEIRLTQAERHVLRISDPPRGYVPSYPQAIVPRLGEVTDVVFRLTKRQ